MLNLQVKIGNGGRGGVAWMKMKKIDLDARNSRRKGSWLS
jgi:hypothetical protein